MNGKDKTINSPSRGSASENKAQLESVCFRPIPREALKSAMKKDFRQHMIDSMTPDRGYPFPVDNVEALISKYIGRTQSSEMARQRGVHLHRKRNRAIL